MGNATTFGKVHLYGITGRLSNATVQNFKLKSEEKNVATTDDENGNETERRRDDNHDEATITLKMRAGYAIPAPSSILVYEASSWEVVSVDRNEEGKKHRVLELSIMKSAYINSASASTINTDSAA